ncbi:MAG: DegT/DnrJ/EryC1/StrS family aminotransferase [Minisyncoccales bacterium]
MYFVHPQIKFSFQNLKKIFFSFWQKKDFEKLKKFFPSKEIVFTDMGRNAFRLIIEELKLQGAEILMPAFLCDVFVPILKEYNLKAIFVDVEKETFNPSLEQIKKNLRPTTKVIFVSHTFGLPFEIEDLKKEIKKEILIIEDCAHAFLAKTKTGFCGNLGDSAFFSLYKQFPIARGGMALLPKQTIRLEKTSFSLRDLFSLLNHFSFFAFLFKKITKKIAPQFQRREKKKKPALLNKFSLKLFFSFLEGYEERIERRKKIALELENELKKFPFSFQKTKNHIFTFFSFLLPPTIERDHFVKFLWQKRIFATRIWKDPIVFHPFLKKRYRLSPEKFPNTLYLSKHIVNLPLQDFYQEKEIKEIVSAIEIYFKNFV